MRSRAAFLLSVLAAGAVLAGERTATKAERERCEAPLQRRIDALNDELRRQGHRNAEAKRAELRRLSEARYACRKVKT